MTDATPAHDNRADDLATSLSRLEVALDRIAVASATAQMQTPETASGVEAVVETAAVADDGVSAHLAGRLDSMIARLRTVIDNGEESTAWLRSA